MTNADLLTVFDRLDRSGTWAYSYQQLRVLFRNETPGSFRKSLSLRAAEGIVLVQACRGLYVNRRATSLPDNVLPALVPYIRPHAFNYVSMESVIGGTEDLSQIAGRLIVVSTGRSAVIETPYGAIEFVRTRMGDVEDLEGLVMDEKAGLYYASHERALTDFRRHGRSHGLLTGEAA